VTAVLRTVRLALGVEVIDAVRGDPADVQIGEEDVPRPLPPVSYDGFAPSYDVGIGLPLLPRGSRPGRFYLAFTSESTPLPPARLRVLDAGRRYVPRRVQVPFAPLAVVVAEDATGARPAPRGRLLGVFPGAAYPVEGSSTGIRGRVVDGSGAPVRWVRAEARHPVRGTRMGYAHGDDRGEFLLLLDTPASALDAPTALDFGVDILIEAQPVGAPLPPPLTGDPANDPLSDLMPEVLPAIGAPDAVSAGDQTPTGFTRTGTTSVECRLGRLISPAQPFVLP
jgi:hypothetical protein